MILAENFLDVDCPLVLVDGGSDSLIDGDKLTDLMFEYNVGVREHRKVEIKKIDEDFCWNEVKEYYHEYTRIQRG